MKVMLTVPPSRPSQFYAQLAFAGPIFPTVGLAYIAAMLEIHGHEVKIIDCFVQGLSREEVVSEICLYSPDMLGVSVITALYPEACELLQVIRKRMPDVATVFGGPHPTVMPEQTMNANPLLDYVVIGEGEFAMLELVEQRPLHTIRGLVYRLNGEIIRNADRPLNHDLDQLPHPARHLLPSVTQNRDAPTRAKTGKVIQMISSRGCPFQCGYCQQLFGKSWRAHSADYLIEEICRLPESVELITFEDDNFVIDKDRVEEFCIKKNMRGLKFAWNLCMRLESVDTQIMSILRNGGCKCVLVGIESGNPGMLKLINKRFTPEFIRKKISIIKSHSIAVHATFILGLPGETKESAEQTIRLALSLPIDGATFNLYTPFPKTVLGELAKKYGTVSDDWSDFCMHSRRPPFIPNDFSAEELLDIQRMAYRRFYLRARSLLLYRNRFLDWQFITSAVRALRIFMSGGSFR